MNEYHRSARGLPVLLLATLVMACGGEPPEEQGLEVSALLGGDNVEGFERATQVRPFTFPEDHGPHPGFRDEWWYVTGNLRDEAGRRYGYQLTFFRHQLHPDTPPADDDAAHADAWLSPDLYMAHFAVSEIDAQRFHHAERFGRPGAAVAGAGAQPFRVWLDDWELASEGDIFSPLRLHARHGELQLSLALETLTPPVPQGDRGLSAKSPEPGNASFYYSMPRLRSEGELVLDSGQRLAVSGLSWLDREWSTSVLAADQVGWDWFALQFDDGRSLMLFQLRRADGSASHGSGGLISADGHNQVLGLDDFSLRPLAHWRSPDGRRYPVRWRVEVPVAGLRGKVRAAMEAQWFSGTLRYWEGAVDLVDDAGTQLGQGYLEMTGY